MAKKLLDSAFRIAAAYFLVAGIYIVVSGYLLLDMMPVDAESDAARYVTYETAKGLGFVVTTTLLLYLLVRRHLSRTKREVAQHADTERDLRRSRDQLAAAQHIGRLGSWEADIATGEIRCSSEVYEIAGVAAEDFAHEIEGALLYVHPDDREAVNLAQRRAMTGEAPMDVEHRIVRPDGEVRYVVERARLRADESGHPVALTGTVQDITERKHTEIELSQRTIQQAAIAELGMLALSSRDVRGLMERAMATAARILDVEYTGVLELLAGGDHLRLVTGIGLPPETFAHATISAGRGSPAGYTLNVNEPVVVEDLREETRFTAPQLLLDAGVVSGITAVVHRGDRPWGVLGVHTTRRRTFTDADVAFIQATANIIGDVLQREQAFHAIEERNMLRQVASEAASLGGWAYDPASNTLSWSEEVARIHEVPADYQPDTERGMSFYAPEHRGRIEECFTACVRDGVPYDEEMQLVTGRGRRIWVRVIGIPTRDRDGRVVRVHGAIQDISERKALESMLHQSQRLEAVGQLTGGIAHDFNNLLTVIIGHSDQLNRAAGDNDELRSLTDTVRQAAERGAELTSRLLAYARKQPLDPSPTDVGALLVNMDRLLRRSLGEKVEVETARAAGLWTAMVDPAQLESAVLNLCLNARDAMPEGGRLTLEITNVEIGDRSPPLHHEISPGQYVVISVTDNGHGVAPELAERVFEPFFTTKPAGQGSGLGLSMVYGFAKQSRGHVKLHSEPDRGTTVKLYLPRTLDEPAAQEQREPERPPNGNGERILVVEDDELVRSFVCDQVRALGYEVLAAASGTEALRMLEQQPGIDLLFTDVVMPGSLDGRQLAEAAHQLRPDLPVLFTSGYTEDAIFHQGRLDPGVVLLTKPYRLPELAASLAAALASPPGAAPPKS